MSILSEFRDPVRDFQAAEIHEAGSVGVAARIAELEQRMGARLGEIERLLDTAERLASERHKWTMEAVARLADINDLRERISAVESAQRTR